jgi:hypothetical protein
MFTLTLTKEQLGIIGNALLDLPARQVLELINEINQQLQKQIEEKDQSLR